MITTTLQQASQVVEIHGAPPAVKASDDEFRASFVAASGSSSTAKKPAEGAEDFVRRVVESGLTSPKVPPIAESILKSSTLATNRLLQASASPKTDETTTAAATDGLLKSGRISLADGPESTGVSAKTFGATVGSLSQALARTADKPTEESLDKPAVETTETAALTTAGAAKKSAFDSTVANQGRDVSASEKEKKRATAAEGVDISGTGIIVSNVTAAVQVAGVETDRVLSTLSLLELGGTSLAERGSTPGTLTSVAAASNTAARQRSNLAESLRISEAVSSGAKLSQSSSSQRTATQELKSTFDVTRVPPGEAASEAKATGTALAGNVSVARSLPKSGKSIAETILEGQSSAATLTASMPLAVVDDVSSELRQQAVQTKSNPAGGTDAKTVLSTESRTVTAETTATSAQLHQVAMAQTLLNSQPVTAGIDVSTLEVSVKSPAHDAIKSPQPLASADLLPGVQGPSTLIQSKSPQLTIGLPVGAVVNTSAAESSSRAAAMTAKSEKPKALDAGAEQSTATSTSASLGVSDARMNNSLNSSAPQVGGAERVHVGAELLTPTVPGPLGNSSVRTANSGIAIAGTTGLLGAADSNTGESGASAAPIAQSHRTLLVTPTSLEVGVQSGTQGWLRIRAEVGDQGGVNATLAAVSNGGRELLHSQMPALNAFLHSEQMAVTTTVADRGSLVTSGSHGGASLGSGSVGGQDGFSNLNGSLLQRGGAQGQESQRDSSKQPLSLRELDTVTSYDVANGISSTGEPVSIGGYVEEGGQWLNIRV